jgi:hypothetical protein
MSLEVSFTGELLVAAIYGAWPDVSRGAFLLWRGLLFFRSIVLAYRSECQKEDN